VTSLGFKLLNFRLGTLSFFALILSAPLFASFQKGMELFQMARYRDAYQAFEGAIKQGERVGDSYYFLGKIFLQNHDYPKAHRFFLRAILKGSNHESLIEDFGNNLEEMHKILNSEKFHALNQKAFDAGVFAIPIVYYLIRALHSKKKFGKVLTLFETIQDKPIFSLGESKRGQNLGLIYYYIALAYLRHKKDDLAALQASRASLKADPQLGIARKLHRKLLTRQKKLLGASLNQAHLAFAAKDYKLAESSFEHALLLEPGLVEAMDGLSKIRQANESSKSLRKAHELADQGRFELALKKVGFAITAWPDNFDAKNFRKELESKILERLKLQSRDEEQKKSLEQRYFIALSSANNSLNAGEPTLAITAFKKALKLRPKSDEALEGLGLAEKKLGHFQVFQTALSQFEKGENDRALPILKKLHHQGLTYEGLFEALILCHFKLEKFREVIDLAQNRLKIYPKEVGVIYHLGRAWEALIETEPQAISEALTAYSSLLSLESEFLDTRGRKNRLLRIYYTPRVLAILVLLLLVIIAGWLYKTRDLRRKLGFLAKVERASATQNHRRLVELYPQVYEINLSMQETLKLLPAFMAALVNLERFEDALKLGPRILSALPEHNQARILMACSYFGVKRFDRSLMKYYFALFSSEYLTEEMVRWISPRILDQNLTSQECLPLLKRFNELVPENRKCRKALLNLLDHEPTLSRQVIQLLEMEVEQDKREIRSRLRLARHYLDQHKIDDCIRICEEVLNLDPGHRELHEIMYRAYFEHKTLLELLPIYDALLQLQPNSTVLQEAKNRILLATGRQVMTQADLNRKPSDPPTNKLQNES
jgi:tetratricopeptide (TPR) repeat protein